MLFVKFAVDDAENEEIADVLLEFRYPKFLIIVENSFFCEYFACDNSKSNELFRVSKPIYLYVDDIQFGMK